jgi:amino acid adenylation domain-containing protein
MHNTTPAAAESKTQVEAMYPVTGIQRGMIFHSLLSPRSGVYVLQDGMRLGGRFDPSAFWRAWQDVTDRHPLFRSLFIRLDTTKPVQVVLKRAPLAVIEHDWRGLPAAQQEQDFAQFLCDDRARGFDFAKAPLMRVALIRCADDEYYFVWTRHHVLLDGWSGPIVLRDMMACYHAHTQGVAPQLPPVCAYQDYVRWLAAQDQAAAARYWQQYLSGLEQRTPLPLHGGPAAREGEIGDFSAAQLLLPAALSQRLRNLVRDERVTLNVLMQGAWALLLARHAGLDEVLFGTTVSGRPPQLKNVESIVGPFINSIPLRVRLPAAQPLGDWLRALQHDGQERSVHEFLPLADIQAQGGMAERGALFDSLLVFDNYPLGGDGDSGVPGLRTEFLSSFSYNNYPLTLMVVPGEQIALTLKYDGNYYSPAQTARLLEDLQRLLAQMAATPAAALAAVTPVDADERARLLALAAGPHSGRATSTLVDMFRNAAAAAPQRAALVGLGDRHSYAWLDQHSDRLAQLLREAGVAAEDRVGLLLGRNPYWPLAMLGILKAGAAFVPLDTDWPAARINQVLDDAQVRVVVTEQQWLERAADGERELVSLDRDWDELLDYPAQALPEALHPAQLAYLIYTSGSTGKPKGVCVTHAAAAAYVSGVLARIAVSEDAQMCALSTFAADLGYTSILGALCGGRSLRLLAESFALDAPGLARALREEPIDVLKIVPSHLEVLLASADAADILPRQCLVLGGETPSLALLATVRQAADCRIVNHYGPTETTVGALAGVLDPGDAVSIGRPMDDRRAYVLDEELRLLPAGATGELFLGGVGVARGYWQDSRQTAQRFLPDPFAAEPGARVYRSGDRVRALADGRIQYLGRRDHQIKLRGYRIELGELEAFVRGQPGVSSAVVNVWQPEGQPARLVAYVVGACDEQALSDAAERGLPKAFRPDHWIALDALPITANGKIDRRALPAPGDSQVVFVAPQEGLESSLAQIWAELLKRERISIDDNFFALGGNSLMIIQAHGQISRQIRSDVSVLDLFKYPTIRKLARHLGGDSAAGAALAGIRERLDRQRDSQAARVSPGSTVDA